MTIPRLSPDGVGRGCFMPCVALCGPLYGVLWHWNIETPPDIKTALRACKWPLRRFCVFTSPLPRWTRAKKCRLLTVGGHASGGKLLEGREDAGKRKPAPGKPRAGAGGIQDFFASSQITMTGRRIINKIIKRGPPPPGYRLLDNTRAARAAHCTGRRCRARCPAYPGPPAWDMGRYSHALQSARARGRARCLCSFGGW